MEELDAGAGKDKSSGKSTDDDDDVTCKRDIAIIDLSADKDCLIAELCELQIQVTSRNSDTADTVESHDAYDKLLDDRKCPCNDDTAFLTRPASDLKKAGCVTIGEEECRICQSSGDEVLISPCKCAGSTKWVHESCLVKWFQVSQTSSCELCSRYVAIKKRTKPLQQVSKGQFYSDRGSYIFLYFIAKEAHGFFVCKNRTLKGKHYLLIAMFCLYSYARVILVNTTKTD